MPSYTLDELIKMMEPQALRDRALMNECVIGLGTYAAQNARERSSHELINKTRELVNRIVGYWGLNEEEQAPSLEEYLQGYDMQVYHAKKSAAPVIAPLQLQTDTINGLFRYGADMIVSQGNTAMSGILDMGDLMKKLAGYWNYEPYAAVEELAGHLTAEVRTMLDKSTLPGQPVSGVLNAGYEIKQAVMFENGLGFVLAHHPDAPSPFVTWRFGMDDVGGKWYEWGNYFSTEERVKIDYISRVADYAETHRITDKPLPTADAELDVEQNYNMLDGVQNNIAVPKPDLTDGQTHEELLELAPEMVDDGNGEKSDVPLPTAGRAADKDTPIGPLSVMALIKSAQNAPKLPREPKPEREKKPHAREL